METLKRLAYKAQMHIDSASGALEARIHDRVLLPLPGLNGEKLYLTGVAELTQRASLLEALYQKIPARHAYAATVLLDAHASATIEGAVTTVERVRAVFNAPQSKDEKMVVNTVCACRYAYDHVIDSRNLRRLWEIVVKDVCENQHLAGDLYRSGDVVIGTSVRTIHRPAPADSIEPLMSKLFDFAAGTTLPPFLSASVFHFYFVYVHPFCDGNGRTARALTSSRLYHAGYTKMKSIPLSSAIGDSVDAYYKSLADSEEGLTLGQNGLWLDLSPFVSYMLGAMEQSFIDASLADNMLSDNEKRLLDRMKHSHPAPSITVRKAAAMLGLSESGTRQLLNGLAVKGYLTIDTSDKTYVYRLH